MKESDVLKLIEWLRNDKLGNDLLNCKIMVEETRRAATPEDILRGFREILINKKLEDENI